MTVAVCYVASPGYMFQTALSALQARQQSPADVPVFVFFLTTRGHNESEADAFAEVLERRGVTLVALDSTVLDGLHPMFGRYFISDMLPPAVDRVLYIDGDTQVLHQLDPLLAVAPPALGVLACRDPMVMLHRVDQRQRSKIERWWGQSGIPESVRERYVNSGVFMVRRDDLSGLGREISAFVRDRPNLAFADQDALNIVRGENIRLLPTMWNFPGFLLGTVAEDISPPRIVHFMSQPRPWNAALRPWGSMFFEPYARLARDEPTLRPYWQPFHALDRWRYVAQQAYKEVAERRLLRGPDAEQAVLALEHSVDVVTPS